MSKKSDLPVEQRREAVLSLLRREETAGVIARRYGVSENTLFRWREDFLAAGEAGLAPKTNGKSPDAQLIKQLRKELAERDQVIGELTIANRLLKKHSGGQR